MAAKRNRRSWKNILINKNVQVRITLINLLFMLAAVVLNTAVLLSSSLCNIFYTDGSKLLQFIDLYALSSEIMVLSLTVVIVLSVACQLVITHQVCGPLVNFSHSFKTLAGGDLTRPVVLRSKDLLKREAGEFNRMLDQLGVHIEAIKDDNRRLLSLVKEITEHPRSVEGRDRLEDFIRQNEERITQNFQRLKLPKRPLEN